MPRRGQRAQRTVLRFVRYRRQPHVREHPVRAVDFRRPQRLAVERNDGAAVLSRRFRHQLLHHAPRSRIAGDATIVSLSRPARASVPSNTPSVSPGLSLGARHGLLHGIRRASRNLPRRHPSPPPESCRNPRAPNSARRSTARRKRCGGSHPARPPSASASRIGDGDEFAVRRVRSARKNTALKIFGSSVEPDLLDTMNIVRLQVDLLFESPPLCAGSVESRTMQIRKSRTAAKRQAQYFRAQAGSAHAQQQRVLESGRLDFRGKFFEARPSCELLPAIPSQPSHCASSVPVQTVASPAQMRATRSLFSHARRFSSTAANATVWRKRIR